MTTTTATTTNTCPVGGCVADGAYDFADPVTHEVQQGHSLTVDVTPGDNGGDLAVEIKADESRPGRKVGEVHGLPECEPVEGSESTFTEPTVSVYGHDYRVLDDLTANEARWLARALDRAADDLDDLTGKGTRKVDGIVYAGREHRGYTVDQLAERAGMTPERVQAIEGGALATNREARALVDALVPPHD